VREEYMCKEEGGGNKKSVQPPFHPPHNPTVTNLDVMYRNPPTPCIEIFMR
jgi:hypothetical protein